MQRRMLFGLMVLVLFNNARGEASGNVSFPTTTLSSAATATTRLLFGSCNTARMPQWAWDPMMKMAPDAWLWLGDSVYGDLNDTAYSLSANWKAATPGHLRRLYNIQKNNPGYVRFMRGTGAKIFGVWDDHDFGDDNADSTYPHKVDSQRAFLDFLDEPKDSPRRKQNGVYSTHLLDNGRIRLILLDVRYNRTPYSEGQDGDFLGEDQWKWFESVLISSQAEVNIIAGGIQFLPPRTTALGIPIAESWTRFPSARERLLNLVLSSGVRAPIFLSGDVHFAEISEAVCSCQEPLENESNYALANESGGGRTDDSKSTPESTLLEFTSSGLTHSWKESLNNPAKLILASMCD